MKVKDLFENDDIKEDFSCVEKGISSLADVTIPDEVHHFNCSSNKLTDLVGSPKTVTGFYDCSHNSLVSLEGSPGEVFHFNCSNNKLTTLEGMPRKVTVGINAAENKLKSVAGIPSIVYSHLSLADNELSSFEGFPREIHGDLHLYTNKFESLKDIHKHIKVLKGCVLVTGNPLKSHLLGVLLIKGVTSLTSSVPKVDTIIDKYLPNHRGMEAVLECQEELINAGLEKYAEL